MLPIEIPTPYSTSVQTPVSPSRYLEPFSHCPCLSQTDEHSHRNYSRYAIHSLLPLKHFVNAFGVRCQLWNKQLATQTIRLINST